MLTTALTLVGLFALRVAVPLVLTLTIGEALRRFDGHRSSARGLAA